MSERRPPATPESIVETAADPRVTAAFLECVPGRSPDETVALVGVVHGHPSSVARVDRVIDLVQPATVAVELPPLATPLFTGPERTTEGTSFGAEMRAAHERAQTVGARTVAIDGFDRSFWRRLGGAVRRERLSPTTMGRLLAEMADVSTHALACHLSARLPVDLVAEAEAGYAYDCTASDSATRQAGHERRHASRSRSLLRAIERPAADRVLDETREQAMAGRLATLRETGPVVAVVGLEHVSGIAVALETAAG